MCKSASAFFVGFLSSLIGAIFSYLIFLVVGRMGEIIGGEIQTTLIAFSFLNMGSFVLALVGSFFCLGISKPGSIILFISATLSTLSFVMIFILQKTLILIFSMFCFPTLFIYAAGIIAKHAKKSPR